MTDHLDQRWCCFNCNTTMKAGELISNGSLPWNHPFKCPHCGSYETHPAEGVVELEEYSGEIPKVLS
jgi:hypothetical protein